MSIGKIHRLLPILFVALASGGCDKPIAIGNENVLLAGVENEVWAAMGDEILEAMEPRIFTVRNEAVFELSQVEPTTQDWADLRYVRNVLVLGTAEDPWMQEALAASDSPPEAGPAVGFARNVWAQGQRVIIVLLEPTTTADEAQPYLEQAGEALVQMYENEARSRMFASGADDAFADSLAEKHGFRMRVPRVYRQARSVENVVIFRNDNPDPSQLIRQVHVSWAPAGERTPSPEAATAWRSELAERYVQPPQVTDSIVAAQTVQQDGASGVEIHGLWSNPPGEWPAGGLFIARMLDCGDRVFLVDAWLYAPGKPKYQYMIQLRTLLESFRCE